MSGYARHLFARSFVIAVGIAFAAALATPPPPADLPPYDSPAPPAPLPANTALYIEPIAGLTLFPHVAPGRITVPVGTVLRFQQGNADGRVQWNGATPISQTSTTSRAECRMDATGEYVISSIILRPLAAPISNQCVVRVVENPRNGIRLRHAAPMVDPVELRNNLSNMETMEYFFGRSVADFTMIRTRQPAKRGEKATELPCYQSSIDRPVRFDVSTDPPGFESLIEVRFGERSFLAPEGEHTFMEPGTHTASIGPPSQDRKIEFAIYRVEITSHISGSDIIPEGEEVTFTAVTDPPGYEVQVNWVSSTKYGTAVPATGRGPTFTVQFDNTWGPHPVHNQFQWLGVKADNATFGQDQKCPGDSGLTYGVRQEGGEFWGYIETLEGQELIAVPFDFSTEEEDYDRARLIGLTIPDMELLEDQPNDLHIALLRSPIVVVAGNLWATDFPCFTGTSGQRRILGTLSATLGIVNKKVAAFAVPPWVPNGCTGVPNFLLPAAVIACCNAHDACYCVGAKPPGVAAARLACDVAFRACIIAAGYPKTARLFYAAVRAFGAPFFVVLPC